MTDDFKLKILKWLTGNYAVESGSNVPQFKQVQSNTNNLSTKLNSYFPNGYTICGQIENANGSSLNAIYGGYQENGNQFGFIYIVDSTFNEVQLIKTYAGGTKLGVIEKINVAEDNTFYGIEIASNGRRLVMLNNFLFKLPNAANYEIVYRQGYTLQGKLLNAIKINDVIKNPVNSRYVISGVVNDSQNLNLFQPYASQVYIQVGAENEWTHYSLPSEIDANFDLLSTSATWNSNDVLSLKLSGWVNEGAGINTYTEYTNSGNNLVAYQILPPIIDVVSTNSLVIPGGRTYIQYTVAEPPYFITESVYVGYIDYSTNEIVNIFTMYNSSELEKGVFYFKKINNQPFYAVIYNEGTSTYKIKIGKLVDTQYYEKHLGTSNGKLTLSLFDINNNYNLYVYYVQVNNQVFYVNQIYNNLNYNGIPYQNWNSMVPNSAIIYNENDIEVFARNLYNRIVNNNTTTSTVQIPNTLVNDIKLKLKELYSETNNLLVNDSSEIETNIYEELLINFSNSLFMQNRNNINDIKENLNGAIRLNNSISQSLDYNNAKIGWYRINYSDGSSKTNPIDTASLTYNNLRTTYRITVYVPSNKNIVSIDLLSNDKNTNYQTIDCSILQREKLYTLTQDVYIN